MARKPVDTRNFTLRMRESLGRKLEAAAQKNRHSLNNEIRIRLEDSFQRDARRTLDELAEDLKATWLRIAAALGAKEPAQIIDLIDDPQRKVAERPEDFVQFTFDPEKKA